MKYKILSLIVLIVILFSLGCFSSTRMRNIDIEDSKFTPDKVVIVKGEKINWLNHDSINHSVIADDKSFESGILNWKKVDFSYQFNKKGKFRYYCKIHPNMKGVIIVK